MKVKETIEKRRAYRGLVPVELDKETMGDLAKSASLAPSCFNKQPWRYIFIHEKSALEKIHKAMSQGNEWTFDASLIIAVISKKEYDCVIKEREYFEFDTGMATAFLILRATELGLVAHPIAGYSPEKGKEILGIPDDMDLVTFVIVGKHSEELTPILNDYQREAEKTRPERIPLDRIMAFNTFDEKLIAE